jgi:hypothetical protein
MSTTGARLKKSLIFLHRWMGVFFCLLFSVWFASGIAMMYWDYPEVSAADRLRHEPALDAAKIRLSPQEAFARTESTSPPDGVLLSMFDGRPVYRLRFGSGESLVYADDGQTQDDFPPEMTLRIAAAWTGQPAPAAKIKEDAPVDQWTVSGEFEDLRPITKYTWPNGEQVYVSSVTGDVVQYTTRASRLGAWFGAIPHWLYFTPLRRHGENWSRVVIWASGLGTIAALLGIVIGVWTYSPSKRYRRTGSRSSLPYTGQKRWHALLGLIFGPLACTWVFSGMLSMDPFPKLQGTNPGATTLAIARALRGTAPMLSAFAEKLPAQALTQAREQVGAADRDYLQIKELKLTSFAGEPVYLATSAPNQTRVIPVRGQPEDEFDRATILKIIRRAAQPAQITESRVVTEYESYYLDRHHALPLPALFVQLDDQDRSMLYIDPKTAQIVQSYDARSRRNRWLYHGLHSINLPALYKHRPAWDILVLALLLGGVSLSITSLLLAWGVLRRQ